MKSIRETIQEEYKFSFPRIIGMNKEEAMDTFYDVFARACYHLPEGEPEKAEAYCKLFGALHPSIPTLIDEVNRPLK